MGDRIGGRTNPPEIANILDVISSACASCLEMHEALDAKTMRYEDFDRILYLISVAKYHHIRLLVLKNVCWMLRKKQPVNHETIDALFASGVAGNKHHLMFHLLLAKLELGCNLMAMDSEMSEQSHKPFVKDPFVHSSKRLSSRLPEMMTFVLKKKLIDYLKELLTYLDGAGNGAAAAVAEGVGAAVPIDEVDEAAPNAPPLPDIHYTIHESYR